MSTPVETRPKMGLEPTEFSIEPGRGLSLNQPWSNIGRTQVEVWLLSRAVTGLYPTGVWNTREYRTLRNSVSGV